MKAKRIFQVSILIGTFFAIIGFIIAQTTRTQYVGIALAFVGSIFFCSGSWGLWSMEKEENQQEQK